MKVLLSIKPKYADKIFSGEKKWEYRKKIWKREGVDRVFVYESTPVKMVTGIFFIRKVLHNQPSFLWEETNDSAGIEVNEFIEYFDGRSGYAIAIEFPRKFEQLRPLPLFGIKRPPQNFMYLR